MRRFPLQRPADRLLTGALLAAVLVLVTCARPAPEGEASAEPSDLILATTTSTQDSGLLDDLVPRFEAQYPYRVKTIAVGTGEALRMAGRGDADVVLAHAPDAERQVVAAGDAIHRMLVMHNDFVIVGPAEDPAGIRGGTSAAEAFRAIAAAQAPFVSRGDDSGTNKKERKIWEAAGVEPGGDWYIESGQGMGATLRIASEKGAYTLTDRGTYLAQRDTLALDVLVEGDGVLLNIYSVMEVNPETHPGVNHEGAVAFSEFIRSPEIQSVIETFGVEKYGQPLFFPDAGKSEEELTG